MKSVPIKAAEIKLTPRIHVFHALEVLNVLEVCVNPHAFVCKMHLKLEIKSSAYSEALLYRQELLPKGICTHCSENQKITKCAV